MKIYRTADAFSIYFVPEDRAVLYVRGNDAGPFIFSKGIIQYESYSVKDEQDGFCKVGESIYRQQNSTQTLPDLEDIINGDVKWKDDNGNELNLKPEILATLPPCTSFYDQPPTIYSAYLSDYPTKFTYSLLLCDVNKNEFSYVPIFCLNSCIINDSIFGSSKRDNAFHKYNLDLVLVWSYIESEALQRQGRSSQFRPAKYHDSVIAFMGHKQVVIEKRGNRHWRRYIDSVIRCFEIESGAVIWTLVVEKGVDDLVMHGDVLYVCAGNEILLVDPKTDGIVRTIDTGLTNDYDRQVGTTITIDSNNVYFTHAEERALQIYNLNSFELKRKIVLPEGYLIRSHQFHDTYTRKHYFSLMNKTQYVARSPLLEVDPANLDAEVEFEAEPELDISLRPSSDNPDHQELWIELVSPSLDDALRFGEIYTRDETQRHSHVHTGMSFGDRKPTANFNGIVRFVYRGSAEKPDVVRDKLKIMEQRFDVWNDKEAFYAGTDHHRLVRLIAEYQP